MSEWRSISHYPTSSGWYYAKNPNGMIESKYFDLRTLSWSRLSKNCGFIFADGFIKWLWIEEIHS